ncbi:MAG: hypothetical protein QF464_05365, partial [Myxococcota bacterium]|nr:hypothetical protein [Myxococcota bacterium]
MGRAWLVALLLGLFTATEARAERVWDRTSLATDRAGLVAVVADPDDPQVAWVASETRVWVTDDGGDAWYLVAQIHGDRRREDRTPAKTEDREDEESTDDEDEEDEGGEDGFTLAPVEDTESGPDPSRPRRTRAGRAESFSPPVIRLRLLGGQVFLTGNRGLWVIDREARALGSAVELRLSRPMAIRDLAQAPWGPTLLATDEGLREIDASGSDRRGRGALGDQDIICLAVSDRVVIAATDEALWRLDGDGATRMGVVGLRRPSDLLSLPEGRVGVATVSEVLVVDVHLGQVTQRWPVSRTERLARDSTGRLWAVGTDGAWSWTPPEGD